MSSTYPVASSADEALSAPLGLAERAREARALAGGEVEFVTESVGPTFKTREALTDVYAAALGLGYTSVRPVSATPTPPPPAATMNADGRRWPEPRAAAPPLWRLSVSYWRLVGAEAPQAGAARALRRSPEAGALTSKDLLALSRQPLRAMKPQQPLDVGLFEIHPPEAPDRLIPDE
jgi:hypothetical protein